MKNISLLIILITLNLSQVLATQQVPDILYYSKDKLMLSTGWGHPSPLQAYYQENNIKYPFTMLHTGNYRGHIATWKIENDRLFITEVAIGKKTFRPKKFKIQSKNRSISKKNKVFADWFNDVLVCRKAKDGDIIYSIYFYVKNGIVQKTEKITEDEFEKIYFNNLSKNDSSDSKLMDKRAMLDLNNSYISYYYRLHDDEEIIINTKKSYINGKNGSSLILEYFNNDHLKWVYNWENPEMSGAPNGVWEIKENKLFLNSLSLHTGLRLDGPQKIVVDLSSIFQDKEIQSGKVLCSWLNGVYIIRHGEKVKEESGYERFNIKEYTLVRINKGIIEESHTISKNFNFKEVPKDTHKQLKKIIEDYKKQ